MAETSLVVTLEAETSRFSAAMSAAARELARMDRPSQQARQSMRLLQNSLQQLSFQAVGVPGPLGKVAQAIGLLGLGGPMMLGVMAGLGALGLLLRERARDAEELRKRIAAIHQTFQGALAAAPGFDAEAVRLQRQIRDAARQRGEILRAMERERALAFELAGRDERAAEMALRTRRSYRDLEAQLELVGESLRRLNTAAEANWADRQRQQVAALNAGLALSQQILAELPGLLREIAGIEIVPPLAELATEIEARRRRRALEIAGVPTVREITERRPIATFAGPEPSARSLQEIGRRREERARLFPSVAEPATGALARGLDHLAGALESSRSRAQMLEAAVISGFSSMVEAAVSGMDSLGSIVLRGLTDLLQQILISERAIALERARMAAVTGVASAAGGAAAGGALAGPWGAVAVAGVTILGSVLSGLFRRRRDVQLVRDDAARQEIERLRAELQRQATDRLVSITIVDAGGRPIEHYRYELDRLSRRDAVIRLPRP